MGKTSNVLVKGIKSMLDVLATVVNDSCLSITPLSSMALEEVAHRCNVSISDSTQSFAQVSWGCVSNRMQSPNTTGYLRDQWILIRDAIQQEILLSVPWSQTDQMAIDDRLKTLTLVLEQEATHILVEELLRDTIDCNVAFSIFTSPDTILSQLTSNTTFVVPVPFQIQFTQNRNFLREFNALYTMANIKDQRQERSTLCIIFVVFIGLLFFIVVVILVRHHWWVLPRLERRHKQEQLNNRTVITTTEKMLQSGTKIVFINQ